MLVDLLSYTLASHLALLLQSPLLPLSYPAIIVQVAALQPKLDGTHSRSSSQRHRSAAVENDGLTFRVPEHEWAH